MRSLSREPQQQGPRNDWKTIRSLLPYVLEFKGRVALAFLFLALAKVANVTVPFVLKQIVDNLDQSQVDIVTLPIVFLFCYAALRVSSALFGELRDVIFAKVTQRTIRRVTLKVFRHLHSLALSFHLERRTGGVSRDIERGSRGISFLLAFMVFNIIPTLLEIALVTIILLVLFDPWFAVITVMSIVIYIAFSLIVTEWRMRFRRTMNELDSKANTRAIDSLLNYETVKYFTNEEYEASRYDQNLKDWEKVAIKNQTSLGLLNFGQGTIIALAVSILLTLAAQGVAEGSLTLGDLVMINAYLLQLFMPLNFLGFVYREIRHSLTDMEKMFNILENESDIRDKPNAKDLVTDNASITFENVNFAYHPERAILKNCSFQVAAGQKVAIVGPSGAGKSTIARLLFRFYDVNAGRILINNHDLKNLTQHSLRSAIGVVPQDTVLFNDSIYYNIAYANPEASREQVIQAAKHAHIHDFVSSLPDGYDTTVGERGLKLSGGEKQRVAIARVILKNPPILLFDEATSALDSKSEKAILVALKEVATQHTTLVIAHRLSTIIDADDILVMDQGKIIERGTHPILLQKNGSYAALWKIQQEKDKTE